MTKFKKQKEARVATKSLLTPDSAFRRELLEERKRCLTDYNYFREHHVKFFS